MRRVRLLVVVLDKKMVNLMESDLRFSAFAQGLRLKIRCMGI